VTFGERGERKAAADQHQQPDEGGPAVARDMLPTCSLERTPLDRREAEVSPHHPKLAQGQKSTSNIQSAQAPTARPFPCTLDFTIQQAAARADNSASFLELAPGSRRWRC